MGTKHSSERHGWVRVCMLLRVGTVGVFCVWGSVVAGRAQEAPKPNEEAPLDATVELRGELPTPRRLSLTELQKLPRTEVPTLDVHDAGKKTLYAGVLLRDVLKAGGLSFDQGMATVRENARASVLVEAADGYRVVFAMAELDPTLTDGVVLLADARDGQPLRPGEGPWRVVVPGDKRPARWVRHVTALTVRRD